jgi:hypothetical protein
LKRAQGREARRQVRSCAASQTDRIELYQTHKDDPETPVEETLEALDRLVKAGKVRAIGASQYGPDRLVESLAAAKRLGIAVLPRRLPDRVHTVDDRATFTSAITSRIRGEMSSRAPNLASSRFFGLAEGIPLGQVPAPPRTSWGGPPR